MLRRLFMGSLVANCPLLKMQTSGAKQFSSQALGELAQQGVKGVAKEMPFVGWVVKALDFGVKFELNRRRKLELQKVERLGSKFSDGGFVSMTDRIAGDVARVWALELLGNKALAEPDDATDTAGSKAKKFMKAWAQDLQSFLFAEAPWDIARDSDSRRLRLLVAGASSAILTHTIADTKLDGTTSLEDLPTYKDLIQELVSIALGRAPSMHHTNEPSSAATSNTSADAGFDSIASLPAPVQQREFQELSKLVEQLSLQKEQLERENNRRMEQLECENNRRMEQLERENRALKTKMKKIEQKLPDSDEDGPDSGAGQVLVQADQNANGVRERHANVATDTHRITHIEASMAEMGRAIAGIAEQGGYSLESPQPPPSQSDCKAAEKAKGRLFDM